MNEITLGELLNRIVKLEQEVEMLKMERRTANKVITTTAPASTKAFIKRMGDKK